MITVFCLLITERGLEFFDIVLETVSAFTTLGISVDTTAQLSHFGKFLILITIIIGRLGALTIILALLPQAKKTEFSYPEERVMIG
jgi:trk system potassium uptake protein TrkH